MTTQNIILIVISAIAIIMLTTSKVIARRAHSTQNKKLTKNLRVLESVGTSLAFFALGMVTRLLLVK